MLQEQCFQLGVIIRKVGTDGRISIQLDTDNPKHYQKTESVFVEIHGKLVPFFIQSIRLMTDGTAQVKFEDIDSEEHNKMLIGCNVYLPLDKLPKLTGNKFYYHEIIGFTVFDINTNQTAGTIEDVLENSPNDLFQLKNDGHEVLIPIADAWLKNVNRETKCIEMDLPDGLIEVNKK